MVASQLERNIRPGAPCSRCGFWLKSQVTRHSECAAQCSTHTPWARETIPSEAPHLLNVCPGPPGPAKPKNSIISGSVRGTNQVTNANRSYPFWLNLSLNRLSRIPNCHGSESRFWQRRFGRACQRFWRPGSDAGGRAAFDKGGEGGDTLGWHRSPLPAPSSAAALVGPAW